MFTPSKIKACFNELVGWRNSDKSPTCFDDLTASLQTSDSGLYVDAIGGMSLSVIDESLDKDEVDLNTYLANSHEDVSVSLIQKFVNTQRDKLNTKALLSNFNIGTKVANIYKLVTPKSRFVGYQIRPYESMNIKVELTQLGVQFDSVQTGNAINIYFYSSTSKLPLQTFPITPSKDSTVEWIALADFIAEYISEDIGSGSEYYIGYYEDDLTGQAIYTQLRDCSTCSNSPSKKYGKYMALTPIEIASGATFLSRELFDVDRIGVTTDTFGLHLKVNATCDVSSVICDNKLLFASVYQKSIAIKLFWDLYNSERINRMTVMNKADARLNAERLELEVEDEINTLSMDFSHIDPICQNCRRRGLKTMRLI